MNDGKMGGYNTTQRSSSQASLQIRQHQEMLKVLLLLLEMCKILFLKWHNNLNPLKKMIILMRLCLISRDFD